MAILQQLRTLFQEWTIVAYVVGGFVRDSLLNRPNHDVDLVVPGDAAAIAVRVAQAVSGQFVLLDTANVVARVVLPQPQQGIAYLDFCPLYHGSIQEDVAQRDFTINALAAPLDGDWVLRGRPTARDVLDLVGGLTDLSHRQIRALSEDTFRRDPARLTRAVRFAAQLAMTIEPRTHHLIQRDADLIATVAGERVRDDLAHILIAPRLGASLRLMDSLGLLSRIIPEVDALRGVTQPPEHYYDVFDHTIAVAAAVEGVLAACHLLDNREQDSTAGTEGHPPLPLVDLGSARDAVRHHLAEALSADRTRRVTLALAALFHDIAKPATHREDEMGIHFYNHPALGAEMAEVIMRRLRFSGRESQAVRRMVLNHMRPSQLMAEPTVTHRAIYRFLRDCDQESIDTIILSLADHVGMSGPRLRPEAWWYHAALGREMIRQYLSGPDRRGQPVPRLLTGKDLQQELGLTPGPTLGKLLDEITEAYVLGDLRTRDDALAYARHRLQEMQTASRKDGEAHPK